MTLVTRVSRRGLRTAAVVALLAFTAGSLDGSLFTLYDVAFASIMTGNMILFGVAFATFSISQAIILGVALCSYCLGVYIGALILVKSDVELFYLRRWSHRIIICLSLSFIMLCSAITVTTLMGDSAALFALKFGLFASAMGLMAAAVRKVGYSVSVTYLTGSITAFWERLAGRRPLSESGVLSLVSVASLISGALTGGLVSHHVGTIALVLPAIGMLAALLLIIATQLGKKHTADAL